MAVHNKGSIPHVVWSETRDGQQILPVNVFDTYHDLVVTAPVPGVEPEDINVSVADTTLTIQADMRGPGQQRRDYIQHEWKYGPYFRRLELPCPVDAERANASFGNGVLTLTLPKVEAKQPQRITVREIELQKTGKSEGHREGHAGHHTGPEAQRRPPEPPSGGHG